MKLRILLTIVSLIMMFSSCEKSATEPTDTTTDADLTDLVGTWEGEANGISLDLMVDCEGKVSGSGVSSQWIIDSKGKVTGGGSFGFISGGHYIVANASWSLQLNSNKTNLSGKFDVAYSGLHDMDVNLTKSASSFLKVYITWPYDGSTVSDTVNIAVSARSSNVITKVEFYIDESLKSTDTSSPYSYSWNTTEYSNGSCTIKVIAYDTGDQTASDQHTVIVSNAKKEDITVENIIGKWYSLFDDPETGMKMVLFLDNRSDSTATIGILNGPTEVSLMETNYYVDNGVYVFIAPEVDTSKQNALQIMIADEMGGFIYADEIYLKEGKLHFVEDEGTVVFSKTIPSISGGTITGSLTVIGEFGQGAAIICAYDPVKETIGGTFLSQPGLYYLQGLEDGEYFTLALYIPKEHALDWMDHDISDFPSEIHETTVTISGSNTVTGINFNLNLSNLGLYKYSINKDTREYKIAVKYFQMLKNLSIFTK